MEWLHSLLRCLASKFEMTMGYLSLFGWKFLSDFRNRTAITKWEHIDQHLGQVSLLWLHLLCWIGAPV